MGIIMKRNNHTMCDKDKQCNKKDMIPLLLIPSIFFTDYFVKKYIEQYGDKQTGKKIFKNHIKLTKHYNTGIVMDKCSGHRGMVLAVSSILVVILCVSMAIVLPKKGKKLLKYGFAFLIGGAAGNLYDRVAHSHVVDYFTFQTGVWWIDRIIFNLSDIAIFCGAIMIALGETLSEEIHGL